jgi:DNA repair exonuclease SbcCD ATPase subunit
MAKIIELRIDNFRRIKAAEIRPDGSVVVISGKNGAGKTSVLHAIWAVLKGRAVSGPTPIRIGAEQCTIQAQTEEFTVTRSFHCRDDGAEITTDLRVIMKDGRRIGSKPQAMLDALLPQLALDPLAFMRMKPKDQVDVIKRMVPTFDFAGADAARNRAFDERTDFNRRAKEAFAVAQSIELPAGPEPEPIDTVALTAEMQAANDHNASVEARRLRRIEATRKVDEMLDTAEQWRARASKMENDANDLLEKLKGAEPLPDKIDVNAIVAKIGKAEEVNKIRHQFRVRHDAMEAHRQASAHAAHLTAAIDIIDNDKLAAIESAKLPVPGLSFNEDMLTLYNLPFESASMSEKLRTSIAIGMALAPPPEEPGLRIMTVDEASELDTDSMALLAQLAEERKYQVWCARIDKVGDQGFVIEDGAIQ